MAVLVRIQARPFYAGDLGGTLVTQQELADAVRDAVLSVTYPVSWDDDARVKVDVGVQKNRLGVIELLHIRISSLEGQTYRDDDFLRQPMPDAVVEGL